MAYNKTIWKDGDVISASKMNKIEQAVAHSGSGKGHCLIHVGKSNNIITSDSTYSEIYQALNNGYLPIVIAQGNITDNAEATGMYNAYLVNYGTISGRDNMYFVNNDYPFALMLSSQNVWTYIPITREPE